MTSDPFSHFYNNECSMVSASWPGLSVPDSADDADDELSPSVWFTRCTSCDYNSSSSVSLIIAAVETAVATALVSSVQSAMASQ